MCYFVTAIRNEIREIENGEMDSIINPLKMAPHTQEHVVSSQWKRPYPRERAAFPAVRNDYTIHN